MKFQRPGMGWGESVTEINTFYQSLSKTKQEHYSRWLKRHRTFKQSVHFPIKVVTELKFKKYIFSS